VVRFRPWPPSNQPLSTPTDFHVFPWQRFGSNLEVSALRFLIRNPS
jgi:hypothetical protein